MAEMAGLVERADLLEKRLQVGKGNGRATVAAVATTAREAAAGGG